jgi:cytochrome c oxidase subunit 2
VETRPHDASPTPDRRPSRLRSRRWALGAAGLAALALTGCQVPGFGAYRGSTTQGQSAFKLWQLFMIAGLIVGGVVFLLILYAALRYRRRSDAVPAQTQYHTLFEITYTIVPILIVVALFVPTVITENIVDATPPGSVRINVTAFQWGWQFYYPATGKTVIGQTTQNPQMVVPVGESVNISLESVDVVHGFYVPEFNFSRYAQPGVDNHFNIDATHLGTFRGQCTQFCGLYHSLMFFSVKAVTPSAFQVWVHQVTGTKTINQLKSQIHAKGPGS